MSIPSVTSQEPHDALANSFMKSDEDWLVLPSDISFSEGSSSMSRLSELAGTAISAVTAAFSSESKREHADAASVAPGKRGEKTPSQEKASSLYENALNDFKSGKHASVIKYLEELNKMDIDDSHLKFYSLYYLARAYVLNNPPNFEAALKMMDKATVYAQDSHQRILHLHNIAFIFGRQGKNEEALKYCQEAMKIRCLAPKVMTQLYYSYALYLARLNLKKNLKEIIVFLEDALKYGKIPQIPDEHYKIITCNVSEYCHRYIECLMLRNEPNDYVVAKKYCLLALGDVKLRPAIKLDILKRLKYLVEREDKPEMAPYNEEIIGFKLVR